MNQTLRIDVADPRVAWSGWYWEAAIDKPLICTTNRICQIFLLFRGTGIKIYGTVSLEAPVTFHLVLDGKLTGVQLNNTSTGVTPIYHAENMTDGDHELVGEVDLLDGSFFIHHFEIENSSGGGFDLLSAGPIAQEVPPQAITVDNIDPTIKYHNQSLWLHRSYAHSGGVSDYGLSDYGGSVSYTNTLGASLSLSFDGVAIWYYGRLCPSCAGFKVSIDGSPPQRLGANTTRVIKLSQRMMWSNTSLDPGMHTITLTHDDLNRGALNVDFFRFLPRAGASTQLSSSTTSLGELPMNTVPPVPPINQSQTNKVPLAVGLTLGLLVLVVVVLCGVRHVFLRRGRRSIDTHSISPYTGSPIRRPDQQSSIPQVRKGAARPSGARMTAVDPAMSSGPIGLGPPPSYETRSQDRREDIAQ